VGNLKECVFVNTALKIQCHIVKKTLLQTAFSAILPTRNFKTKLIKRQNVFLTLETSSRKDFNIPFKKSDVTLDVTPRHDLRHIIQPSRVFFRRLKDIFMTAWPSIKHLKDA